MRWGQITVAAIIGLLTGLAWCYFKQIKAAYDNKDVITSGIGLAGAASDFYGALQKKV